MIDESQKPVTDNYRKNWDKLFGKKKTKKSVAPGLQAVVNKDKGVPKATK